MMVASVARFPKKATYCEVQLLRHSTTTGGTNVFPVFIMRQGKKIGKSALRNFCLFL